jgi:hypothetical protein
MADFIRCKKHKSVLQDWVAEHCSLRMQGTLVSAVRGCDTIPKGDVSKKLVRGLRSVVLNSPVDYPTTFLAFDVKPEDLEVFLKQPDQYPVHWLFHFMHAVEVVGWMHPDARTSAWWLALYYSMCNMLHVNAETKEQFYGRLHDGDKGDCWKS